MNNLDSLNYQVTTATSYGQVRAIPLVLANELISRLEQWFQNCKFHHLSSDNLTEEAYNAPLQLEFTYSLRVLPQRNFSNIKADVVTEIDLLNYHLLVKIIHEYIEEFYKNYLALTEEKQGNNVLSFKNHVNDLSNRFHKKNFPDKLNLLEKKLESNLSLDKLKDINRIRNCLEHRAGVVSKKDCDPEKNYMSIIWRYPKIISSDGEFSPISNIKGKQNAAIEFVDEVKKFECGGKIIFNFHDNYKCLHTVAVCFKNIIDAFYVLLEVDQEQTPEIIREFK